MSSSSPTIAICGSFSFDSVVGTDGVVLTGKVGGNALWSSAGALLAGAAPRVVTIIGADYPEHVLPRLAQSGIDVSAVTRMDGAHPVRLTFLHRPDGSRVQPVPASAIAHLDEATRAMFVDTTTDPSRLRLGAPTPDQVPERWLDEVDLWHLPLLPWPRHVGLVRLLASARGALHADCPARSDLLDAPYARLSQTLSDIDVFLPSTSDFDVIDPGADLPAIVAGLQGAGVGTLVVKSGADGTVVVDRGDMWHVPAYDDAPVDPTGAGDAFCGGFLAGRAAGLDLVDAAALGAATASFAIAVTDPLALLDIDVSRVRHRARALRADARPLDLAALGGS